MKQMKEITEDIFMDYLNVLPPLQKTHKNNCETFKLSELYSGDIAYIFARIDNKYYQLKGRVNTPHDDIVNYINNSLSR